MRGQFSSDVGITMDDTEVDAVVSSQSASKALMPMLGWWGLCLVAAAVLGIWWHRYAKSRAALAAIAAESPATTNQLDPSVPLVCLINPKSGGGLGSKVMAVISQLPQAPDVFPLSRDGIHDAIKKVLQLRARGLNTRIVCAGGDGTVTAIVRMLLERNLASVPVAVMPLGTGNDCARSLGMSMPVLSGPAVLKWLLSVQSARVVQRDVFDLYFDTHTGGSIVCVRNSTETQLAETVVRGTSLMYTSIGLDSRCVYTVELHRQRNRLLNQCIYFLAGAFNTFAMRPPVSDALSSLTLDGCRVLPASLPFSMQSLVCLLIPSYAGGTNIWQCAWSLPNAAYRAMFEGRLEDGAGAALPASLLEKVPKESGRPGLAFAAWCNVLSLALRCCGVIPRRVKDAWSKQCTDDGCFELLGARTLFHLGGAVGLKTGALGGLYRLAQPRTLLMEFTVPKGGSRGVTGVASPDINVTTEPLHVRSHSRFSPSMAAAAIKRAVKSTAKKIRPRKRPKAAVMAPPEMVDDDELLSEAEMTESEVEPPTPARGTHMHARGYALVPSGRLCVDGGSELSSSSILPPGSQVPPSPLQDRAQHGDPAVQGDPSHVLQGGSFSDTEPIFLQVDGEGYKIFALRQVSLTFRARANLVSLNPW
jgi:hypothetical protein